LVPRKNLATLDLRRLRQHGERHDKHVEEKGPGVNFMKPFWSEIYGQNLIGSNLSLQIITYYVFEMP
jgi:hypothetical protein